MGSEFESLAEAVADAWASIDGKSEAFWGCKADAKREETEGRYGGYMIEADEMIARLKRRGFVVIPILPLPEPPADALNFEYRVTVPEGQQLFLIDPPADAEVAQAAALGMAFDEFQAEIAKSGALIRLEAIHQAERAVIEAAVAYVGQWADLVDDCEDAFLTNLRDAVEARQRSAAAKDQG